jgi:peptidoglycan/LPS O-acetylase OafA/YrhL
VVATATTATAGLSRVEPLPASQPVGEQVERGHGLGRRPIPYNAALDGIRAIAVLSVLAYHFERTLMPGGFLGVDVFFVLSGYLITSLLVVSRLETGKVGAGAFWAARARRLLPALSLTILGCLAMAWLAPSYFNRHATALAAFFTLAYSQNWYLVATSHDTYFSLLNPSPLLHTWSLAVEEQFYAVWPLVVALALSRLSSPKAWRARIFLAGGVLSCAGLGWELWLVAVHASQNLIYYNSLGRVFELAAGATLSAWALRRDPPNRGASGYVPAWLGALGFTGLMAAILTAPDSAYYLPYSQLAAVASTLCLVASVSKRTNSGPARLLGAAPLAGLGRISYGFYLWHWPAILLFQHLLPGSAPARAAAVTSATLVAALVSYRLVERPVREGRRLSPRLRTLTACAMLACTAVPAWRLYALAPPSRSVASVPPIQLPPAFPATLKQVASYLRAHLGATPPAPVGYLLPPPQLPVDVTFVGDSVMYQLEHPLSFALKEDGIASGEHLDGRPGWSLAYPPAPDAALSQVHKGAYLVVAMFELDNENFARLGATGTAQLLEEALAYLFRSGTQEVLFLQAPPLGPQGSTPLTSPTFPGYSPAGAAFLSRAEAQLAREHPGKVAYLPISDLLARQGRFASFLPAPDVTGLLRVRQLDDFHLCQFGAARYALAAELYLAYFWHAPAHPGRWWTATTAWASPDVFDHILKFQPPGQCPSGPKG